MVAEGVNVAPVAVEAAVALATIVGLAVLVSVGEVATDGMSVSRASGVKVAVHSGGKVGTAEVGVASSVRVGVGNEIEAGATGVPGGKGFSGRLGLMKIRPKHRQFNPVRPRQSAARRFHNAAVLDAGFFFAGAFDGEDFWAAGFMDLQTWNLSARATRSRMGGCE